MRKKKHFQAHSIVPDENGKKIDAIRQKIEKWKAAKEINDNLFYFLLASLIESIDKVANTASVYGAFLKKFKNIFHILLVSTSSS